MCVVRACVCVFVCVCVGGGGPVTFFKVNFNIPKFQGGGGPTYVIRRGGGRQTFFQGVESSC